VTGSVLWILGDKAKNKKSETAIVQEGKSKEILYYQIWDHLQSFNFLKYEDTIDLG
jgi:hypothetical protein